MVVLVHLLQDTERTIIPYLNKEETLEGLLNDGYRTWKNKLNERKNPLTKTQYHYYHYQCYPTYTSHQKSCYYELNEEREIINQK